MQDVQDTDLEQAQAPEGTSEAQTSSEPPEAPEAPERRTPMNVVRYFQASLRAKLHTGEISRDQELVEGITAGELETALYAASVRPMKQILYCRRKWNDLMWTEDRARCGDRTQEDVRVAREAFEYAELVLSRALHRATKDMREF